MHFAAMLVGILLLSALFMPAFGALANTGLVRRYRTREDRPFRISPAAYRKSAALNAMVSGGLLLGVPLLFRTWLILDASVGWLRTLYESAAILALYDLGYYLLHRFLLHEWSVGRRIHSVHHTNRTPYAKDSLYIHPIETAAGVGLLLLCSFAVGPVGASSFAVVLLIYALLNVFIHSNIDLPFFPFRSLTALVRNHNIHHDSMKAGYYASITPLWDYVFGTAGRPLDRS